MARSDRLPQAEAAPTQTLIKAHTGPFTLAFYRRTLERIQESGAVLTISVSTGADERVFFFTRGAILFLATGASGGHLLERKIVAKGLLKKELLEELRSAPGRERPILQEVLRENKLLDDSRIQGLVNEVIEEQLLEVALFDEETAIYDLIPGNPPARLYDKNVPAIRLSIGLRAMLAAVIPKLQDIPEKILRPLGGSLKQRLKPNPGAAPPTDPVELSLLEHVPEGGRTGVQAIASACRAGIPAYRAAVALASLATSRKILAEAREETDEERAKNAATIEGSLDQFVNRLIARQHLAQLYEKLDDKERAGDQLREISTEYVERDRLEDAIGSLEKALGLVPRDLAAREGMVKVLTLAKRNPEAGREAMSLGQLLLELGLPGRARNAFGYAAKLMPRSLDVLWKLATLSEGLNDRDEAIRRYEEIAEIAKQSNDKAGFVSAKQRILKLDPKNRTALKEVRKLSGYQSALYARLGVVAGAFVAGALAVSVSWYELNAARLWATERENVWRTFDEGKVADARALASGFAAAWRRTRAGRAAEALGAQLEVEGVLRGVLVAARETRFARESEERGSLAEALGHWTAAIAAEPDQEKRTSLGVPASRCQSRVLSANEARETARALARAGNYQKAHEVLAQALESAPWLGREPDVRLPCLIDSVPTGQRLLIDGRELASNTPATVERPIASGWVVVLGKRGEQAARELPAIPPWPFVVVLPRPAVWLRPEIQATAAPLLTEARVYSAGRDRALTAVARDSGAVVFRHPLGVFGDVAVSPVLLPGAVLVRTTDGTVVAVDEARGTELWRQRVAVPPEDGFAPARLAAVTGGVVVREGPRGLACLRASDGQVAWRTPPAAEDLVGAPHGAGDLVLVARGTKLAAYDVKKGTLAWETTLPAPATSGPELGPRNAVFVALRNQVARLDLGGRVLSDPEPVKDPVTAIDADEKQVALGLASGDVVLLDSRGKLSYRRTMKRERPVTWVRPGTGLVLVGDGQGLVAFDTKLGELWRDANPFPASFDTGRVYQVGSRGLAAVER